MSRRTHTHPPHEDHGSQAASRLSLKLCSGTLPTSSTRSTGFFSQRRLNCFKNTFVLRSMKALNCNSQRLRLFSTLTDDSVLVSAFSHCTYYVHYFDEYRVRQRAVCWLVFVCSVSYTLCVSGTKYKSSPFFLSFSSFAAVLLTVFYFPLQPHLCFNSFFTFLLDFCFCFNAISLISTLATFFL